MLTQGVRAWALAAMCLVASGQVLNPSIASLDIAPPGFSTAQKSVSFADLSAPSSGYVFEIPASDPLVAPPANQTQFTPEQIHVTLAEAGSVWLSWATGFFRTVANPSAPNYPNNTLYAPVTPDLASVASVVEWGTATGVYPNTATGYQRAYIMTYLHDSATYVSQMFHHVHVTGLPYGQTIFYKVGDPTKELSAEFTLLLKTSIQPKTFTYPMRLGVVADIGQTYNSSVTYQHLVADSPDAVVFIGDLSYADDYNDQGVDGYTNNFAQNGVDFPNPSNLSAGPLNSVYQTYQPRWDTMGRLLQRSGSATSIPYMFLPGNHEIELDELERTFQSYTNRYRSPYEQSYSQDPLYYSLDVGPVHVIMLNAYGGFLPNTTMDALLGGQPTLYSGNDGAPVFQNGQYPLSTVNAEQLSWVLNDLKRVNRAATPWVIVNWHQPAYNSYSTHFREADCLRQTLEPFLYNAGVDIVMHARTPQGCRGHVHAYERVYQTLNYAADGCAPRWLTMGDGGNLEGLYRTFAAINCTCTQSPCPCKNVTPRDNSNPSYCATLPPAFNGLYAPPTGGQPPFSAYREPSFGHGTIDFLNSTHALWRWNRNQDGQAVVTDSVYFVRNPACPNQLPGTPLTTTAAPTSTPAPTAAVPQTDLFHHNAAAQGAQTVTSAVDGVAKAVQGILG